MAIIFAADCTLQTPSASPLLVLSSAPGAAVLPVVAIVRYGWDVADSVTNAFWGTRLALEAPDALETPPEWNWTSAWSRWQEDGDSRTALEELERHWPQAEGKRTGIAYSGLMVAVDARDLAAADRWAGRVQADGRDDAWSDKLFVAGSMATLPALRERGLRLAREALAEFDVEDLAGHPGRPLGRTVDEYGGLLARSRAEALTNYGELLADAGLLDEVSRKPVNPDGLDEPF